MDKELHQADVATFFGVTEICVTNWENGRGEPQVRYMPKVVAFLGVDPYLSNLETFGGRLKYYRQRQGLSHKGISRLIGVDAATISAWENGENNPLGKHIKILQDILEIT